MAEGRAVRRLSAVQLGKTRTGAERQLTAILAADVAGYSRLVENDEEGTLTQWKAHWHALLEPKIKEFHGRIVRVIGDGVLVEFASVVDAVRCAVEVQRGMAARNAEVPHDKRIEFRMGINFGELIIDGRDFWGDAVNIAARLEALAEPGGICVSGRVQETIKLMAPHIVRIAAISDLASPSEMGMLGAIQAVIPAFAMPFIAIGGRDAAEFERARLLHRSNPQGRKASRPAGGAVDQIRVCHQHANGQSTRPRSAEFVAITR
jgi:class 3 adenylate cyclase